VGPLHGGLVLAHVLDGERGMGADLGEEFLVLPGEGAVAFVQQLDDADDLAPRCAERRGEDRAGLEARRGVRLRVETRVSIGV
jgi:hypothetical protein